MWVFKLFHLMKLIVLLTLSPQTVDIYLPTSSHAPPKKQARCWGCPEEKGNGYVFPFSKVGRYLEKKVGVGENLIILLLKNTATENESRWETKSQLRQRRNTVGAKTVLMSRGSQKQGCLGTWDWNCGLTSPENSLQHRFSGLMPGLQNEDMQLCSSTDPSANWHLHLVWETVN